MGGVGINSALLCSPLSPFSFRKSLNIIWLPCRRGPSGDLSPLGPSAKASLVLLSFQYRTLLCLLLPKSFPSFFTRLSTAPSEFLPPVASLQKGLSPLPPMMPHVRTRALRRDFPTSASSIPALNVRICPPGPYSPFDGLPHTPVFFFFFMFRHC